MLSQQCHKVNLINKCNVLHRKLVVRTEWKTIFGGGRPLVEDVLRWKTTFVGRRPAVEHDLQLKTTCSGAWPSVDDNLRWILACCLLRFAAFLKEMSKFSSTFMTSKEKTQIQKQMQQMVIYLWYTWCSKLSDISLGACSPWRWY